MRLQNKDAEDGITKTQTGTGAGRKPQGFSRKAAKLTMRMEPAHRTDLERAAKKRGVSLSQAAQYYLRLGLRIDRHRDRDPHIQALGEIVALLAQWIESKTDKHWNKDVFTSEALRRGIDVLVSHFAPRGTPATPINLEKEAAKIAERGGDVWEAYCSPVGLGETEARHVMTWIEISHLRPLEEIGRADAVLRERARRVYGFRRDGTSTSSYFLSSSSAENIFGRNDHHRC
jgi:hypothetical protein